MKSSLLHQVVWITGSSRGIGRETALAFLKGGSTVILNGRDPDKLQQTASQLARACSRAGQLDAWAGDVTDPEQVKSAVEKIRRDHGRLDILVNNAGLSMRGDFSELKPDVADTILRSNLQGVLYPTLATLPLLQESRGQVVFISSLAGLRGFPGISVYSMGKMALTALAQSLRAEWKTRGIHVGIVYPGFTENDPEKTILTADGHQVHHQRQSQLTQGMVAQAVLRLVLGRKKRLILTWSGKLLALMQAWAPGFVDWVVSRSAGKIHKVEKKKTPLTPEKPRPTPKTPPPER